MFFILVPSQPPAAFKLTASSSTSITASWQLPPVFARHGRNITGFKLFYREKGSVGSATTLTISSGSTLSRNVTWLDKYTEYEFQKFGLHFWWWWTKERCWGGENKRRWYVISESGREKINTTFINKLIRTADNIKERNDPPRSAVISSNCSKEACYWFRHQWDLNPLPPDTRRVLLPTEL